VIVGTLSKPKNISQTFMKFHKTRVNEINVHEISWTFHEICFITSWNDFRQEVVFWYQFWSLMSRFCLCQFDCHAIRLLCCFPFNDICHRLSTPFYITNRCSFFEDEIKSKISRHKHRVIFALFSYTHMFIFHTFIWYISSHCMNKIRVNLKDYSNLLYRLPHWKYKTFTKCNNAKEPMVLKCVWNSYFRMVTIMYHQSARCALISCELSLANAANAVMV
jgi:hypothetical protein